MCGWDTIIIPAMLLGMFLHDTCPHHHVDLVDPERVWLILLLFVCESGWKVLIAQVGKNIQTPFPTASFHPL